MKIDNKKIYEIFEANPTLLMRDKAQLCNEHFGTEFDESTFRKRYAFYKDGLHTQLTESEEYERVVLKEINVQTQMKKNTILRSTVNKVIRNKAFGELIQDVVLDIEFPQYSYEAIKQVESTNEWYLLSIADYHYNGYQDLKEFFGQVYNIIIERGMKELFIFSLGDEIEGLLRVQGAMESKIGAVKQMREYTVHFLNFLQELSKKVKLTVYQVESANHSQTRVLGTGRDELEEDLLELLTAVLEVGLKDNPNVKFIYDKELHVEIGGFKFYLEHGHKCKNLSNPAKHIKDKIVNKNIQVDYYYMGHIHHFKNETLNAREGFDFDYTFAPSCKEGISRYEDGLNLSSNSAILLEKFDKNGRVSTEKIILK